MHGKIDKLVSVNGEDLFVEEHNIELTEEPVSVYNFQVEETHTYFVGKCGVWVHNAECMPTEKQKGFVKSEENADGSITVTKKSMENVDVTYAMAEDGHYYPRFEEYADYSNPNISADFSKPIKVDGKMTGNYANDSSLINQQLGLSETPTGYVWYHVEDGKSMLLVQQKIHSIKFGGFTHRGGASIIRANI